MERIFEITTFVLDSFLKMWPYLLVTIPLAVAVNVSGAAKFIKLALTQNPVASVVLATAVGAFSPFCSCSVIPVITSLLIGGVPLAPVMSFWIASPSMDPEIFFLSTATIGWELSVWRLAATFVISLLSGLITHIAFQKGWLGNEILRKNQIASFNFPWKKYVYPLKNIGVRIFSTRQKTKEITLQYIPVNNSNQSAKVNCCISADEVSMAIADGNKESGKSCSEGKSCQNHKVSFHRKLLNETWKASFMVAKFMTLAFLINALIRFYVPQDFVDQLLGGSGNFSVFIAALVGIPVYTSNITALPLLGGLLSMGMNHGAALAFLIAGPTTTLPAMVAVYGIVRKKIFFLYISFSLIGAILFGLLYNLF